MKSLLYAPIIVAIAISTLGGLYAVGAIGSSKDGIQQGIIVGQFSIGPLCPVEPCKNPPSDIYSSRYAILQPKVGDPLDIKLNSDGSFQAKVRSGTYTLNLSNCNFLGCSRVLPKTVTIEPNEITEVSIDIDTGIR